MDGRSILYKKYFHMHLFIANLLFLCPVNVAFLNKISLKSQSCVFFFFLSKTSKLVLYFHIPGLGASNLYKLIP